MFVLAVALGLVGSWLSSGGIEAVETEPAIPEVWKLPSSDKDYKRVKEYIEDTPVAGYQHLSAAALEAFRDMKYGIRIHWGIYSILGKRGESWPFLKMSYTQKATYEKLYKTWNPTGFNAEEWMTLFADNGLKMFAITTKHHEGFSMFDTKTREKSRVNWGAPGGPKLEDCDLAYSIKQQCAVM